MFSISCLSKQFQQDLLLLASKHSLVIAWGLVLALFDVSAFCDVNGFYMGLYLMITDLSVLS